MLRPTVDEKVQTTDMFCYLEDPIERYIADISALYNCTAHETITVTTLRNEDCLISMRHGLSDSKHSGAETSKVKVEIPIYISCTNI